MAITINGSANTVAGLAVGGLPDGTVDRDTVAADLIDGTKLADDAIANEHVAANAIQNAQVADDAIGVAELSASGTASSSTFLRGDNSWAAPGGGKIIQFKQFSYSTEVTGNSGAPDTGLAGSIAKTDASNKILMIASHELASNTGSSEDKHGPGIWARKSTDSTGLGSGTWENLSQETSGVITKGPKFDNTNNAHWHAETSCLIWYDHEDTTNTVWYKTIISRWTANTSYYWAQPDGRTSYLYLLEVDD